MKTNYIIATGIAMCAFVLGGLASDTEAPTASNTPVESVVSSPAEQPVPQAITIATAKAMFKAYHNSKDLANSQGVLKLGDGRSIESYLLDYQTVVAPLKQAIEAEGKVFHGICIIPAKDPATNDFTLMFMGVSGDPGNGTQSLELYVAPMDSSGRGDFIYDQTMLCPDVCSVNHDILWEE